ncbi:MAG: hypothetical protein M0R74_20240, partial [Dehalococcoidia bacterium]|nr:hypothetical protein [Dehalococcoidia bacterium]
MSLRTASVTRVGIVTHLGIRAARGDGLGVHAVVCMFTRMLNGVIVMSGVLDRRVRSAVVVAIGG